MIRLEGVRKTFVAGESQIHALDGVSLEIERGEFVAIMGQSGSGKSTMMNIIGLLDRPDEGAYLLSGQNVAGLSEHARARLRGTAFGFVFQSYSLLPRMSALEQVELPLIYQGVRDRRRRSAEALVRVGLADRIGHRPTQLSGGEQQRVAIARSLVVDPLVVLADEPTGALDTATGHDVMMLLSDLVYQHGMTIILVTHEKEVADFAQRTIRMRDGQIIEDTEGRRAPDNQHTEPRHECARCAANRSPGDHRQSAPKFADPARSGDWREFGDRADRGRPGHTERRQ